MKLEVGPSVVGSYKRLPYKAWYALAEFVDNSTQSYFNHRDLLNEAYEREGNGGLVVRIVYDRAAARIRVADNAYGMDEDDLARALQVGRAPEDPSGRSRYGLGMKMAACWFGDEWKIVTTKLGSSKEFTVTIDVQEISANGDGTVKLTTADAPLDHHYTRIEISRLNGRLQGRTLGKTKDFLASMYAPDIESGTLPWEWDGGELRPQRNFEFLRDQLGNTFRKEIALQVDGRSVSGWVGILGRGARSKAGFGIRYQNRMVRTWPDAWKPSEIFGEATNNLLNQRLTGELFLDEFTISHTKDDIQWEGSQEDDLQDALREELGDWISIANRPYGSGGDPIPPAVVSVAVEELNRELNSGEMQDLIEEDVPPPEVIAEDEKALLEETDADEPDFGTTLRNGDSTIRVVGFTDFTKSPNDPYVLWEPAADGTVIVVINMRHPHVSNSVGQDGLLSYFQMCTYDVLAEWKAMNQNAPLNGTTWRHIKDRFLRITLRNDQW